MFDLLSHLFNKPDTAQAVMAMNGAKPTGDMSVTPATMPKPDTRQQLIDAARAMANGGQVDFDKLQGIFPEARKPEKDTPSSEDWKRILLDAGLGMMAAGGQRGATFLGSLGQGGAGAISGWDRRRKDKRDEDREDRREMSDATRTLFNTANVVADNNLANKKFSHDITMDDKRFGLDQQRVGMEGARLGMERERMGREGWDTITGSDGSTYRMNKYTGQMEPLTINGETFKSGDKNLQNMLTQAAVTQVLKNNADGLGLNETPLDQQMRDAVNAIQGITAGKQPAAPAPGGATAQTGAPAKPRTPSKAAQQALSAAGMSATDPKVQQALQYYSDDQIIAWLKNNAAKRK